MTLKKLSLLLLTLILNATLWADDKVPCQAIQSEYTLCLHRGEKLCMKNMQERYVEMQCQGLLAEGIEAHDKRAACLDMKKEFHQFTKTGNRERSADYRKIYEVVLKCQDFTGQAIDSKLALSVEDCYVGQDERSIICPRGLYILSGSEDDAATQRAPASIEK